MNDGDIVRSLLRCAVGADPGTLPTSDGWERWAWFARMQRVVPLLYHLVDIHDPDIDDNCRRDAVRMQGNAMVWAVRLEHQLLEARSVLADAGIDVVVLKGLATAHCDYVDPTWRQVGDIDILVDPSDLETARSVLEAAGWQWGYDLPVHHEEFTHAVTYTRSNIELDMHQHLGHRAIGRLIPTVELCRSGVTYSLAGTELTALSSPDRLIHASIHALTSRGSTERLSSTADVLVLAERHRQVADAILERAAGWGVASLVDRAVSNAYGAAGLAVPGCYVWEPGPRRSVQRRLLERAYLTTGRHPLTEEGLHLWLLPGWRARCRYVGGHLNGIPRRGERRARRLWNRVGYLVRRVTTRETGPARATEGPGLPDRSPRRDG